MHTMTSVKSVRLGSILVLVLVAATATLWAVSHRASGAAPTPSPSPTVVSTDTTLYPGVTLGPPTPAQLAAAQATEPVALALAGPSTSQLRLGVYQNTYEPASVLAGTPTLVWDITETGCFLRPVKLPLPGQVAESPSCQPTEEIMMDATTGQVIETLH